MNQTENNVFDILNKVDCSGYTKTKQQGKSNLTYLSWTWAWAEFKKRYPDATYSVWKNEIGLPYSYDEKTGYIVYTSVTCEGITHEMWLPVMDGQNKAMKSAPYTYETKYNGSKTVEAATMFDINKTIMRCLTKNLAMFGLGLYIYAGEDLPETDDDEESVKDSKKESRFEHKKEDKKSEKVEKQICKCCGAEIVPYISPVNGKQISPAVHSKYSVQQYGDIFCLKCIDDKKKSVKKVSMNDL